LNLKTSLLNSLFFKGERGYNLINMKEKINKLWKVITNANKILLINHIRMDMDAFWSLSAMYDILWQLWKEVKAINDEIPLESYAFTWYNQTIEPELNVKEFNPDLIISFDAASLDQLGNSYKNNIDIFNEKEFYVIDHHKTNPWFGKVNIINPEYSSTCELTYDIIEQLDLTKYITPKIATSLISWIYTDTNIFYNSNTTSNTHFVTWKLFEYWADFRKPYYEFYQKKTYTQSKLWWEVLTNYMKISKDWKLVWAMIPKSLFTKVWAQDRQLTWLISEFFANIEWVEICFISHEIDNNLVKTSFRSTEKYDTSEIAQFFWWWWHKQAAWFSSNKTLKEVEKDILEKIKKEFNF
jgi:phosphoesterase RecJ-like protein